MHFLTNIYDPRIPESKFKYNTGFLESPWHAEISIMKWIQDKILGDPKAERGHTVEQLKAMGIVGVYSNSDEKVGEPRQWRQALASGMALETTNGLSLRKLLQMVFGNSAVTKLTCSFGQGAAMYTCTTGIAQAKTGDYIDHE